MLQDMSSVASSALVGALVEAKLDELSNGKTTKMHKIMQNEIDIC